MTSRVPLSAQARWAEGQARQHARIASRNPAGSAARARAEQQRRLAEAAAETLAFRARIAPQQETA